MSSYPAKPAHDLQLEGLRGLAALLVALGHLWSSGALMPVDDVPHWLRSLEAGHSAVLLFFVLSGYVIGLTNPDGATLRRVSGYFQRRALRVLPIYWIALVFTAWVLPHPLPWDQWLPHVALLQNNNSYFGWLPVPPACNTPTWSLHYELVFYLAFPLLWYRPDWLGRLLALAVAIAAAGLLFPALPQFPIGWAAGWLFWSAGWWLARQPASADSRTPVLSGVLLLLAVHNLRCGDLLAGFLSLDSPHPRAMVNFTHLLTLPACLLLIGGAARRAFSGRRFCLLLAFAIPLGSSLVLVGLGRLQEFDSWMVGAICTGLALACLPSQDAAWLRWWAPLGRVSYAFYLLHLPLLFLLARWGVHAGSVATLVAWGVLWFFLSAALAALLELGLQPRLRGRLQPYFSTP